MQKPIKHVEKAIAVGANAAWFVFDKLNSIKPNPGFTPKWADKPLLKSWEKTKPPLGWPRDTDSLMIATMECRGRVEGAGGSASFARGRSASTSSKSPRVRAASAEPARSENSSRVNLPATQ